jgi:RNA-binding protein YhbY
VNFSQEYTKNKDDQEHITNLSTPGTCTMTSPTRSVTASQIFYPAAWLCICISLQALTTANAFSVRPPPACQRPLLALRSVPSRDDVLLCSTPSSDDSWDISEDGAVANEDVEEGDAESGDVELMNENDFEVLFKEEVEKQNTAPVDGLEKAWRYAKKTLLSIGAKGAQFSHGNSLRQLLESHTIVKVKVNTQKFGTLEAAFEQIRDLALEAGAPEGIEMVQHRVSENTILFGRPGTLASIEKGDFPPPPPPPYVPRPYEARESKRDKAEDEEE